MSTQKATLRQHLRELRLALSPVTVAEKSAAIADRLIEAETWRNFESIHVFRPIIRLQEVDITRFVDFLRRENAEVRLYTSEKRGSVWETVSLAEGEGGGQQAFGAVIVPMLGFDAKLHRIGYGGGYYDRLLAAHPEAKKIGVCFEMGKVPRLPTEPHDIPMDLILTEEAAYKR